jgi:hypothetical protein
VISHALLLLAAASGGESVAVSRVVSVAELIAGVRMCERLVFEESHVEADSAQEGWIGNDGRMERNGVTLVFSGRGPTGARCAVAGRVRSDRITRELYRRLVDDRVDTTFAQDDQQSYIIAGDRVFGIAMTGTSQRPAIRIAVSHNGQQAQ